jgi:hypothetical protein
MVQNIPGGPRALDVETGDPDVDPRLRDALFQPSAEVVTLAGSGETELRFHWAEGEIEATKTLRFRGPGYLVRVEAEVKKAGRPLPVKVIWGPGLGNPTPEEMEVQGYHAPQGVSFGPRGVERLVPRRSAPCTRYGSALGGESRARTSPRSGSPSVPGTVELRAIELPAGEDGQKKLGVGAAVPWAPRARARSCSWDRKTTTCSPPRPRPGRGRARGEWIGPIVIR